MLLLIYSIILDSYVYLTIVTLALLTQKIKNQFIQRWHDVIANQPKMEYHRLFILLRSFQYENYLDCITNVNITYIKRKHMFRFRLSSNSFEIENGRYYGVVRHERKCSTYKIRSSWPNLSVFVNVMSSQSIRSLHSLSKYT